MSNASVRVRSFFLSYVYSLRVQSIHSRGDKIETNRTGDGIRISTM